MAMSASLQIMNNTGSDLMFTSISPVNDDSTWSAPAEGSVLASGSSDTISMGNSSVIFAPKGVGCNVKFICKDNFELGQIYLDDPAVGSHSFHFGNEGVFDYVVENPTGNSYVVKVLLLNK